MAQTAPTGPALSPISAEDEPAVLALNNAFATELSWLEPNRLHALLAQAFYARQIGAADAFLIAFDQNADYDSPNFLWFRARFARFVYIDRVAVAPNFRKQGHARRLYTDLITCSRTAGHGLVVCEVNSAPPNPVSDAFHAALGFVTVGSADIHGGSKTVRYLARSLQPEPHLTGAGVQPSAKPAPPLPKPRP